MVCTGQRCTATSRVYVERSVAEAFRKLLADEVSALVVGDPYDDRTDVGPLVSAEQRDNVSRYLEIAREEKADVIVEGDPGSKIGFFLAPTVLSGIAHDSVVLIEEIFGPVLVVVEVNDFDDALRAANDTEFGLSSAIFTSNLNNAMAFVRHTQSGLVHINRETAGVEPHVPFGGLKASSNMAREQGKAARTFFTTTKTVYLRSSSG
jgi:aldehyde dehydrogenase (NAD+)